MAGTRFPLTILATLLLAASAQSGEAKAQPPAEARFGDFSLSVPAGWERAPAEAEKEVGAWQFGYTGGKDPKKVIVVAFHMEDVPYKNEAARTKYLATMKASTKKKGGKTYSASTMTVAGAEADVLSFQEKSDGSTSFYVMPSSAEKVYQITVMVPEKNAAFPEPVKALLGTLRLGGKPTAPVAPVAEKPPAEKPPTKGPVEVRPPTVIDPVTGRLLETGSPVLKTPAENPAKTPPVAKGPGKPVDELWTAPAGKPAGIPARTFPARVDSFLDIKTMTREQYTGAVSAAMEAMRVLMGPISPEQNKKFEAKWAPYFQFPNEEMVEYLNKLNPLMGQFLAVRAALAAAAMDFDNSRQEAAVAASYGSEAGVRAALEAGRYHRDAMLTLQATMAGLVAEVEALGNPPDPKALQEAARRRHKAAVGQVRDLIGDFPLNGDWVYDSGKRVSLQAVKAFDDGVVVVYCYNHDFFRKLHSEVDGDITKPGMANTKSGGMIMVPGLFDLLVVYQKQPDGTLITYSSDMLTELSQVTVDGDRMDVSSYRPPSVFVAEHQFGSGGARRVERTAEQPPVPRGQTWAAIVKFAEESGAQKANSYRDYKAKRPDDFATLLRGSVSEARLEAERQEKREQGMAGIKAWVEEQRKIDIARNARSEAAMHTGKDPVTGGPYMTEARIQVRIAEAKVKHEQFIKRREAEMIAELEKSLSGAGSVAHQAAAKTADQIKADQERARRAQEARAKANESAVAERNESIRYFDQQIARDRAELVAARDPKAREYLEWHIRCLEADAQGERDQIQTIQTGQFVHTRTAWDEQCLQRMVQKSVEYNQKCDTTRKICSGLQRMIREAPPEEADFLRDFVNRQIDAKALADGDVEKARKVAGAVFEKVQGSLQAEAAKQDEKAAWANLGLEAATNIKTAADYGMTVTSMFGGQGVMYAYQASTGYIEGGPVEAVKRVATTYSDAADYAVTAYEGYQEGGWSGLAQGVGIKYIQGKVLDYAVGKIRGDPPDVKKPTVQEQFEAAKFKQEREWGESLAKDFGRKQAALEAAGHNPKTPPQEIARLQKEVRDSAAAVASAPAAKNYLKYKGDYHARRAYDTHSRATYAEVDAKMMERMKSAGYDTDAWELKEFRNAESIGSVNMDRDVGLDEKTMSSLMKGGEPASLHQWQMDAQDAYRKAYKDVTGRSADQAWQTVTTSAHPEAYKDAAWLGKGLKGINPAWAPQAADVTGYKAAHTMHDPANAGLTHFGKLQEVSRGSAKDMNTKLLPLLKNAKPKSPEAAQRLLEAQRHWQKVQSVLESFGKNDIDPIYAQRRIREITGGKGIGEVVDEMGTLMTGLVKMGKAGQ